MKNKLIVFMLLAFSGFAHAEGDVVTDPTSYLYYAEQLEKNNELIDNSDLTNSLLWKIVKNQEKLINHLINNKPTPPQG